MVELFLRVKEDIDDTTHPLNESQKEGLYDLNLNIRFEQLIEHVQI